MIVSLEESIEEREEKNDSCLLMIVRATCLLMIVQNFKIFFSVAKIQHLEKKISKTPRFFLFINSL